MSKIAVVYWSGTGNTEAMANLVADGAKAAGAEVDMFTASEFDASKAAEYTGIAFGCPAMGAEVLEDSEFEPMYEGVKSSLGGKALALFGSYGWGDGEWMRNWKDDIESGSCSLQVEPVICCGAPEGEVEDQLKAMGDALAKA